MAAPADAHRLPTADSIDGAHQRLRGVVQRTHFSRHRLPCGSFGAARLAYLGWNCPFWAAPKLITLLSSSVNNLGTTLSKWSNQVVTVGPFSFQVPELTTKYLSDLLIGQVQPILEGAGGLIATAVMVEQTCFSAYL